MVTDGANVNTPLASARRACQAGNLVIRCQEGSYILNKATGKRTQMRLEKGNYVFDFWVKKAGLQRQA